MTTKETFFLIEPGFRPAYYELAEYLWGADAGINSDGDSENPGDGEWTELTIELRRRPVERVDIDPVSREPLVLKVVSTTEGLARKAALYLQARSGGSVSSDQSDAQPGAPRDGFAARELLCWA